MCVSQHVNTMRRGANGWARQHSGSIGLPPGVVAIYRSVRHAVGAGGSPRIICPKGSIYYRKAALRPFGVLRQGHDSTVRRLFMHMHSRSVRCVGWWCGLQACGRGYACALASFSCNMLRQGLARQDFGASSRTGFWHVHVRVSTVRRAGLRMGDTGTVRMCEVQLRYAGQLDMVCPV